MKKMLGLGVAATLAIVLAACSSPGVTPHTPPTDDGIPDIEDAPLSVFMDDVYGFGTGSEAGQKRAASQHAEIETLVASCMSDEGVEYTPVPYSAPPADDNDPYAWDRDSRDLVTQYGYGFVESPTGGGIEGTPAPEADTNAMYRDSLTPSEQAAYDDARYRGMDAWVGGEGGTGAALADPGCQVSAEMTVRGEVSDPRELDQFAPLFDAVQAFQTNQLQWTGMADLQGEWVSCMNEAGYPGFTQQSDASGQVGTELSALRKKAEADGTQPSESEIAALGDKERTLALADLDCRDSLDYTARYSAIVYSAQEQFMADHKADVDAVQAWFDQAGTR